MTGRSVCLNMIVKNEAHIIQRCLENVRSVIDYWVIVDTGSTDGTQDLIRETYRDVPGELHERPWKNFGHNRSEAIALAAGKADYILTIDADEWLDRAPDFRWNMEDADAYMVLKRRGRHIYPVKNLVRDGLPWKWEGVLHEYLTAENEGDPDVIDGITIVSPPDGARAHDPHTYKRDALTLEAALLEDPDDRRSVFYLAQSYRDCKDDELALRWYNRRIAMGGWSEEIYIAKLNIARIHKRMKTGLPAVIAAYLEAHSALPRRAEALYELGMVFADQKDWPNAWLFLGRAAALAEHPYPGLFMADDVYTWRAAMEAAVAAHYAGDRAAAVRLNEALLAGDGLPGRLRAQVEDNLRWAKT